LTDTSQYDRVVLFLLTDGIPTDARPEKIQNMAQEFKAAGVYVMSCFFASKNEVVEKQLFSNMQPDWSQGAKLMWECSSRFPSELQDIAALNLLEEKGWIIEDNFKLFTQLNHSQHLEEYLQVFKLLLPVDAKKSS